MPVPIARHDGSVALVTGAGSGIGRATALRLAAEGATVVGCDIDPAGLARTAELAGQGFDLVALDVTDQHQVDGMIAGVLARYGQVDILANVAGVMDGFLSAHDVDDETWRRVMAVNVDAPLRLARAVLPGMIERRAGAIVNVASEAGLRGGAAGVAYTASKHALIGLTKSIAWTYAAEAIRCNVVCPGSVNTSIAAERRSEWARARQAAVAGLSVRRAEPDELAASISWLASEEAANVNGAVLASDAGWSAG